MLAARLGLFYAALFLIYGIQLPFWPIWLSARGLDAQEIGVVLAMTPWVRTISTPLIGALADAVGDRRRIIIALSVLTLAAFGAYRWAGGFASILLIGVFMGIVFSALMPLGDTLTLQIVRARQIDYGRVRIWGSAAFIAANLGGGWLLADADPDRVLALLVAGAGLTVVSAALLPATPPAPADAAPRPALVAGWRRILTDRGVVLLLAAAFLIQSSHAVLYGFGTLHWRSLGLGSTTMGWLWAESVIAEIALFAVGTRIVARLGAANLLIIGGLAGVLRWTVAAEAEALPVVAALQFLHALTFGATHLASMHILARAIPPELSATGQSLFTAVTGGVAFALVMTGAGWLYAEAGPGAYLAMAAMAAVGAACGWAVGRTPAGRA